MHNRCWFLLASVLLPAVLAFGQANPPVISPNPPAQGAENPAPPQNAKNAKLIIVSGLVSDSFCLRHHYMLSHATDEECVRYCIAHHGSYAVLSGNNVYELQDDPGHVLSSLANRQVSVTGWLVDPTHIEIKSVTSTGGAKK